MTDQGSIPRPRPVPASRISRVGRLGSMSMGIASGAAWNGMRLYAAGDRPEWRNLLLTPANLRRVADELARMRGAAMKVGQLLSMDAGDVLPPELAEIMARLRSSADFMPPRQLRAVLTAEWGADWRHRFERFDVRPLAAASIGQVHRARLRDGGDLAIKIQYPGIRRSIDSDVDNVATLARVAGLIPQGLALAPLLAEAKRQLHEEADYLREGRELSRFARLLAEDADFTVPRIEASLTTPDILAMSFLPGAPIEDMTALPQAERDRIVARLLALTFRELFVFGVMQTDPNFANYRYDTETGRIALLDFGAARAVAPAIAEGYRALFRAGLGGSDAALCAAARALGLFAPDARPDHRDMVMEMLRLIFAQVRSAKRYDFADAGHSEALRVQAMRIASDRSFAQVPPMDVLYVQRKLGGLVLLARTLRARVDVGALLGRHL